MIVKVNLNTMKATETGRRGKFGTLLQFTERTYRMPNGVAAVQRRVTVRGADGQLYTGQYSAVAGGYVLKVSRKDRYGVDSRVKFRVAK